MSKLEEFFPQNEFCLFDSPHPSATETFRGDLIDQSSSISQETNGKEKKTQLIYPFVTLPQAFYCFSSVDIGLLLRIRNNHCLSRFLFHIHI